MAKSKKEKVDLNAVSQAHGALSETRPIHEILGYTTGYTEASIDEYQQKLEKMTDTDLHEHAVEKGIVPDHNRVRLVDKLEREYIIAHNKYIHKTIPSTMSKENQEILRKALRGAI